MRELKADPATRLIPFVLITGLSDSADKLRGIEAGADDFLNKPVLAEELTARVKSLLRVKEFTDELETVDSVLCTLGLIVEGAILIPKGIASGWPCMARTWDGTWDWMKIRSWRCGAGISARSRGRSRCRMRF